MNITIIDNPTDGLVCLWHDDECYAECLQCNIKNTSCLICFVNLSNGDFEISNKFCNCSCQIHMCSSTFMLNLMHDIMTRSMLNGLETLSNLKHMCMKSLMKNLTVLNTLIDVERAILREIMNTPFPEESKDFYFKDLALRVVKINFTNQNNNQFQIKAPERGLPVKVWIPEEAFEDVPEEKRRAAVVMYQSAEHLLAYTNNNLVSTVIRIEVTNERPVLLSCPLKIHFTTNNISSEMFAPTCQYFNDYDKKGWDSQGCINAVYKDDSNTMECTWNHMTPFAILMTLYFKVPSVTWNILTYISYIGSGLSIFFTAASIISFIITRKWRVDQSSSIHASLNAALFLLNVSFMLSEWAASMHQEALCICVAVAMQYGLLSSFTWMAIEAVHLYLVLIRVFKSYFRHYIAKLSMVGWGVPLVLVVVPLTLKDIYPVYGSISMTMKDNNQTNHLCWIMKPIFMYGMNLTYFSIIFLLNHGILCTVAVQIWRLRRSDPIAKRTLGCKDVLTLLGFTCLLGSTWGLSFLSNSDTSYVILYLFCIFNTLQGFLIFLWICGKAKKQRQDAASTIWSIENSRVHLKNV
ncbi:adhesion G-protein coupled receptor G2-like isoform X2 [Denticeps clupeoides]|nr:adhesion G-protein coupled receptor G2-like isoform X2 [Denticeps clupeoides]